MNEWEARQRAIKAFKLSRVLLRIMDNNPAITIERIEKAGQRSRHLAAQAAGVHDPSEQTWTVMIDLLKEQRG